MNLISYDTAKYLPFTVEPVESGGFIVKVHRPDNYKQGITPVTAAFSNAEDLVGYLRSELHV